MRRIRASALAAHQTERALGDAYTDALTGLYNRRYLDEDLLRRVARRGRESARSPSQWPCSMSITSSASTTPGVTRPATVCCAP